MTGIVKCQVLGESESEAVYIPLSVFEFMRQIIRMGIEQYPIPSASDFINPVSNTEVSNRTYRVCHSSYLDPKDVLFAIVTLMRWSTANEKQMDRMLEAIKSVNSHGGDF